MTPETITLAREFRLYGILAHMDEIEEKGELCGALQKFLSWELSERRARKYKAVAFRKDV